MNDASLNTWLLAFIALCQLLTPIIWWIMKGWVMELAVNTNSIKDALVESKGVEQHAVGMEAGRQLGREEAKEDKPRT